MDEKKTKLYLPVKLTPEELHEQSKSLANSLREKTNKEGALESFKAQIKADVAQLDATIDRAAALINSEIEYRDVDCLVKYDWEKGVKSSFRLDTGEQVRQENVTAEERQQNLELEGEVKS